MGQYFFIIMMWSVKFSKGFLQFYHKYFARKILLRRNENSKSENWYHSFVVKFSSDTTIRTARIESQVTVLN